VLFFKFNSIVFSLFSVLSPRSTWTARPCPSWPARTSFRSTTTSVCASPASTTSAAHRSWPSTAQRHSFHRQSWSSGPSTQCTGWSKYLESRKDFPRAVWGLESYVWRLKGI